MRAPVESAGQRAAERIEDYAVIGDGESMALVSCNGSIDWLCWPRFDSGACFAALLGTREHGYWSIAPAAPATRGPRRYRGETLILETVFECEGARVLLVDFMPRKGRRATHVVRTVRALNGRASMHMEFKVRFEYGSIVPWISQTG